MSTVSTTQTKRILSIDILRGIVMIIMALDHTRDYFSNYTFDPTDISQHNAPMFFTRWITHFCAPVFIFLSGTSAFLSFTGRKTKKEAAWFLLTRGLWLIILELTIIRFGWQFNLDYTQVFVQVIWAIGWSMIFLAGFIFLPLRAILAISLLLIFGHNLLDGIHANELGTYGIWWSFVHEFGIYDYGIGGKFFVLYPLVPWIGVMAAGYCFGNIFHKPEQQRNKWLYSIGISAMLLFIILRWINIYGDPMPWEKQSSGLYTFLSFLNCAKYPPSLLYLLMTIGPAITLMPLLDRMSNAAGRFFTVYGRVPMFYYILHIYLLHSMAMIVAALKDIPLHLFTDNETVYGPKPGWGYDLPYVYLYWLLAVILLYLPCRWFMQVKMTHKKWWLSYL